MTSKIVLAAWLAVAGIQSAVNLDWIGGSQQQDVQR
jgi:hypothetical protein